MRLNSSREIGSNWYTSWEAADSSSPFSTTPPDTAV